MAIIGYARVSSRDQHLNVQLEQLNHCDRLFQEKQSGLNGDRPQLRACLEYVREGDVLVITRVDRLARSTLHLCQITAELERKGVNLQVLEQNIDTGSAAGRLLFNVLGLSPNLRRRFGQNAKLKVLPMLKLGEFILVVVRL